jgi:hypothetical protein
MIYFRELAVLPSSGDVLPLTVYSAVHNFNRPITDWTTGVRSSPGTKDFFPLAFVFRPSLKLTQRPVQWVPGSFPDGKHGRGGTLTTHFHLVPRSRRSRCYSASPPWFLYVIAEKLYFFYNLSIVTYLYRITYLLYLPCRKERSTRTCVQN